MIPRVLEYLDAHWDTFQLDRPRPRRLSFIMQSRHRVNAFVLDDSDGTPLVVVRLPRDEAGEAGLRREREALSTVHSLASAEFCRLVPRPLAMLDMAGTLISIETVLHGQSMRTPSDLVRDQKAVDRHFGMVYEWLLDFEYQMRVQTQVSPGEKMVCYILTILERLQQSIGGKLSERGSLYLHNALGLATVLGSKNSSLGIRQKDIISSNILLSKGTISGVVDWENASLADWPFYDWCHFLNLYCYDACQRKTRGQLYHQVFVQAAKTVNELSRQPAHPVVTWTHRFFDHYGIEPELIPLLFLVYLATHPDAELVFAETVNSLATERSGILVPSDLP